MTNYNFYSGKYKATDGKPQFTAAIQLNMPHKDAHRLARSILDHLLESNEEELFCTFLHGELVEVENFDDD